MCVFRELWSSHLYSGVNTAPFWTADSRSYAEDVWNEPGRVCGGNREGSSEPGCPPLTGLGGNGISRGTDEEHPRVAVSHTQPPASNPLSPFPFMQASVGRSVSCVVMGISVLVDTALCRREPPENRLPRSPRKPAR